MSARGAVQLAPGFRRADRLIVTECDQCGHVDFLLADAGGVCFAGFSASADLAFVIAGQLLVHVEKRRAIAEHGVCGHG